MASREATDPQIKYIMGLCRDCGISAFRINRDHETLPHMDMRFTAVDEWAASLTTIEASEVIQFLRELIDE